MFFSDVASSERLRALSWPRLLHAVQLALENPSRELRLQPDAIFKGD